MKKHATLLLYLLIPFTLFSQTIVDSLNVYGTWTKAGSPYLINHDIAVASYDTLIIEKGVQVIFEDYYLFQVFGHFSAIGTENDSIYFTVADTAGYYNNSHNGWGGIDIIDSDASVNLNYCRVEYSKASGIFAWDGQATVIDSKISHCESGIVNDAVIFLMERFEIGYCLGTGLDVWGMFSEISISDFKIHHCGGTALYSGHSSDLIATNGLIEYNGQGIIVEYESRPDFESVEIMHNGKDGINGGGIYSDGDCFFSNCNISYNYAQNGGGIYAVPYGFEQVEVSNCIISNNIALEAGGGLYIADGGVDLSNSDIFFNTALIGGGAYFFYCYYPITTFNAVEISQNQADQNGGGIYVHLAENISIPGTKIHNNMALNGAGVYINNLEYLGDFLKNLLINSNHASSKGGGIYLNDVLNWGLPTPICHSLTITENIANTSGGGISYEVTNGDALIFKNTILWANSDEINDPFDKIEVFYSDIQGGWPGTGNIDADPLFVDPENGNFNLSWLNFPLDDYTKSPCIGSGADGVDMGAYAVDSSSFEQFMPVINSIVDVPDDQGKQVVINWTQSSLDDNGGTIEKYTIWRKQNWAKEPWEYMGFTPAQNFEEYAFIAPTISDSTAIGIPYFTYLVSAVSVDTNLYYYSYPDSGYSVDNIAPYPPEGLQALLENDTVFLSWNNNLEADFDHYALYKSLEPDNFPNDAYLTTSDTLFSDSNISNDTLYYLLTAFDYNGNESFHSEVVEVIVGTVLDLKVFLEGPYFVTTMIPYLNFSEDIPLTQPYYQSPWNYTGEESVEEITNSNIVDWLLLEFRDAVSADSATSETKIYQQAAFVLNDGGIVGMDGFYKPRCQLEYDHNLYLVIWHRNHLGIMTSIPIEEVDGVITFDFTSNPENVLGGNKSLKNLGQDIWGMIAADGNADGNIDNQDKNDIWFLQNNTAGYLSGDYNMDSEVDHDDKIVMWEINVGKGTCVSDSISNLK